jgi:hypothetical protein
MSSVKEKVGSDKQMYFIRRPFRWPRLCVEAIQMALPNAACPGLPRKPLFAAIGQPLALYHPSGRQGNSKKNSKKKWTNFAGHFDGRGGALV